MRLVSFHVSVSGKIIKKDQDDLQQLERNGRLLPTQSSSKQDEKSFNEIPNLIKENKLENYFRKRFILFEQYNKGIQLDAESWYSVTPQCIAEHIAKVSACSTVIDAFCGAGGTAIQFAKTCKQVIAIDIDKTKIQMAQNNARIYGVEQKIKFIHGDFLTLADHLKGDVIFLDPPWGGPGYKKRKTFNIENILSEFGSNGIKLFEKARQIKKNIIYHLPRNTNVSELQRIFPKDICMEIVEYEINNRKVSRAVYFGDLARELQSPQLPLYDKGIEVKAAGKKLKKRRR